MGFSDNKLMSLGKPKEKWLSTFFIALATAAAFFIPFIVMDKGYFLFYGDFNVQQVPFYKLCHEAVRTGNFGWNWGTDLGVDFIGSYSFYLLGSPFFWLTLPFPTDFVPHLMGPLLILKFALSALTGYIYIRRFTRTPEAARLGGLLYAFSGFSVYNIFFNHFHEAIVVFPLLLWSVEKFLAENRRGYFALMVALAAISNYFFFYGMVVFVVIYFFVRMFSGCYKFKFSVFLWFVFEAVLGLLISAAIMLPTMASLFGNSRLTEILHGWGAITYGKEQIYLNIFQCFFFPPDIPARPVFFPEAEVEWSSLGGWLPLFSMVGVFAFMQQKKGSWLRRMIGILIFMALVPILNSAFYMFNHAYYARWYYMPVLLMCLATVYCVENTEINWRSPYKWVTGITLATVLVIGLFPREMEDGKFTAFGLYTQSDDNLYLYRFLATSAIAVVSLIILGIMLKTLKRNRLQFIKTTTALVVVLSVIYAAYFIGTGKTHSYDTHSVMIDALLEEELELPGDKNTYRIDVYDSVDNTAMYLGYSSINAFHSVVPVSVTDFWEYVGEERGVASRPTTASYAARSLLGVKYLLERNGGETFTDDMGQPKMSGFKFYSNEGKYTVWENENYLPYGFTYDYYITKEQCDELEASRRSNMMVKAILLSDEQIAKYGYFLDNIEEADISEWGQAGSVHSFMLDTEELEKDAADRRASAVSGFERTKNGFKAEISTTRDQLVFFSIPFERGWTAKVNGAKVGVEQVNVGFMAVPVSSGDSEIVFEYENPNLRLGIIISFGAILVFVIYILVCGILRKTNHFRVLEYPEGDKLLEQWKNDVAAEKFLLAESYYEETIDLSDYEDEPKEPIAEEKPVEELYRQSGEFNRGFWVNIEDDSEGENEDNKEVEK